MINSIKDIYNSLNFRAPQQFFSQTVGKAFHRIFSRDNESNSIQAIFDTTYGDKNDEFHKNITQAIRSIKVAKLNNNQEMLLTIFKESHIINYPACVLKTLLQFQKEFPEIFSKNYEKDLIFILELYKENQMEVPDLNQKDENYKVNRSPKEFDGNRLIIGCGHYFNDSDRGCHARVKENGHPKELDFCVDLTEYMEPDIQADFYSNSFWKEFADEKFEKVILEGFVPGPHSPALKEISRILKKGGTLEIGKDALFTQACQKGVDITEYFKSLGFSEVRIEIVGRVVGGSIMDEREMESIFATK